MLAFVDYHSYSIANERNTSTNIKNSLGISTNNKNDNYVENNVSVNEEFNNYKINYLG